MPLGTTVTYARWSILVSAIWRLPTKASTIVNSAMTTVAAAETTAAQSAACSNKTTACKLDMADWLIEGPDERVLRVRSAMLGVVLPWFRCSPRPLQTHGMINFGDRLHCLVRLCHSFG